MRDLCEYLRYLGGNLRGLRGYLRYLGGYLWVLCGYLGSLCGLMKSSLSSPRTNQTQLPQRDKCSTPQITPMASSGFALGAPDLSGPDTALQMCLTWAGQRARIIP